MRAAYVFILHTILWTFFAFAAEDGLVLLLVAAVPLVCFCFMAYFTGWREAWNIWWSIRLW